MLSVCQSLLVQNCKNPGKLNTELKQHYLYKDLCVRLWGWTEIVQCINCMARKMKGYVRNANTKQNRSITKKEKKEVAMCRMLGRCCQSSRSWRPSSLQLWHSMRLQVSIHEWPFAFLLLCAFACRPLVACCLLTLAYISAGILHTACMYVLHSSIHQR